MGALIAALVLAPHAEAGETDVYGLITPDEAVEISANGWRHCGELDRVRETEAPVSYENVIGIVEGYRADGWDQESAGNIVWDSVKDRCSQYLPQVEEAMDSLIPAVSHL